MKSFAGQEKGPILVVPRIQVGMGGGHLARCSDLVALLRKEGREAYLYIGPESPVSFHEDLAFPMDTDPEKMEWNFIILDLFKCSKKELEYWESLAPVVGLDEGGAYRSYLDFCVDMFPGIPKQDAPNRYAAPLMCPPEMEKGYIPRGGGKETLRVLVSFGAEDPAGLTIPTALALAALKGLYVEALFGPLNPGPTMQEREALKRYGVVLRFDLKNLKEHLGEYDLLITHYGLTSFEALYIGIPVLLLSPTRYHLTLSQAAGFTSAGTGRRAATRLAEYFKDPEKTLVELKRSYATLIKKYRNPEYENAAALMRNWFFPIQGRCPLCGSRSSAKTPVLARFQDRSYKRCSHCGMVYMLRPLPSPMTYNRDYFFDDYKNQYGKTYIEDFGNIKALGEQRVARIMTLLEKSGNYDTDKTLRALDIGCAYGPFLDALRDRGVFCVGIDPSEAAVRYVSDTLDLPAVQGNFPEIMEGRSLSSLFGSSFGDEALDVISLWYVIEHLDDLGNALSRAAKLLRRGGVLAFSTPSFTGVSGCFSRKAFLQSSPVDHWTLWEPHLTSSILARFGFTLAKIHYTGHHPERLPFIGAFLKGKTGFLYKGLYELSRLFNLGDTYEAYAIKTEDITYGF